MFVTVKPLFIGTVKRVEPLSGDVYRSSEALSIVSVSECTLISNQKYSFLLNLRALSLLPSSCTAKLIL